MPLHIQTPLLESLALSRAAGTQVWLKLEALQPPGSFKLRGVGLACEHHRQRGATRFVSSSGGNAGLAVAHAGRSLSVPVVGFTVERGRPASPLAGATVEGSVGGLLRGIDAVARVLAFSPLAGGMIGAPSLLVSGLEIRSVRP